jgi:hypothetical protein
MPTLNNVKIRQSGSLVQPAEILVRNPSTHTWQNAIQILVYQTAAPKGWKLVYQLILDPPATLTPGTATNSSATLSWTQVPSATEYQVVVRKSGTSTPTYYPSATTGFNQLSYTVPSLSQKSTYTFTVVARRKLADGGYLASPESTSKLTLWTGNTPSPLIQNPSYPATDTALISAIRADTWTANNEWTSNVLGGNFAPGDVVQGYEAVSAKNAYGCVRYGKGTGYNSSGVYNQLLEKYGATVFNMLQIMDAKIDYAYRKTGGAGTPVINVYPCDINFNSAKRPVNAHSGTTFRAPVEGDHLDDFEFVHDASGDRLLNWVNAWANNSDDHNGILIFNNPSPDTGNATAGYNGYCIFRGLINDPDWRLRLSVKWHQSAVAADPARWIP